MALLSEKTPKSLFNSAGLKVIRLSNLWNQVDTAAINGELNKFNGLLDRILSNLISKTSVSENDRKEIMKKLNDFNNKLIDLPKISEQNLGFKKQSTEEIKLRNKLYCILLEKEIFIKNLEDELGIGDKYEESMDDYMD